MGRREMNWPVVCTLAGCWFPTLRGHHHHYNNGHLSTMTCECDQPAEPGTRPKEA